MLNQATPRDRASESSIELDVPTIGGKLAGNTRRPQNSRYWGLTHPLPSYIVGRVTYRTLVLREGRPMQRLSDHSIDRTYARPCSTATTRAIETSGPIQTLLET